MIKELKRFDNNIEFSDDIEFVADMSDPWIKRVRVFFKNGFQLSIINSSVAYCKDSYPFEIAIMNRDGCFVPYLFDEGENGDDVLGYCSIEKVNHYIKKIGNFNSYKSPCSNHSIENQGD
jgi:hypothetical protein